MSRPKTGPWRTYPTAAPKAIPKKVLVVPGPKESWWMRPEIVNDRAAFQIHATTLIPKQVGGMSMFQRNPIGGDE